jgi:hypothetical protein
MGGLRDRLRLRVGFYLNGQTCGQRSVARTSRTKRFPSFKDPTKKGIS